VASAEALVAAAAGKSRAASLKNIDAGRTLGNEIKMENCSHNKFSLEAEVRTKIEKRKPTALTETPPSGNP
jgi:hypothetical protein